MKKRHTHAGSPIRGEFVSGRLEETLAKAGIETWGDLAIKTRRALLGIRGVTQRDVEILEFCLEMRRMHLADYQSVEERVKAHRGRIKRKAESTIAAELKWSISDLRDLATRMDAALERAGRPARKEASDFWDDRRYWVYVPIRKDGEIVGFALRALAREQLPAELESPATQLEHQLREVLYWMRFGEMPRS